MTKHLGVSRGNIELRDYDPAWVELFEQEKVRLAKALGKSPIEHIGSTAIPGLRSKPILDIMAALDSLELSPELIERLEGAGYEYRKFMEDQQHHFLWRLEGGLQVAFLKLTTADTLFWKNNLIFRDRLRSSPALVECYQQLKDKLAAEIGEGNRPGYTAGKGVFIRDVIDGVL